MRSPFDHLQCCGHFVLCTDVVVWCLHQWSWHPSFLQLCWHARRSYVKQVFTPNMHLRGYLKLSLHHYGPFIIFAYFHAMEFLNIFSLAVTHFNFTTCKCYYKSLDCSQAYNSFPGEFNLNFGDMLKANAEPALQGSLNVAIHNHFIGDVGPQNICVWNVSIIDHF